VFRVRRRRRKESITSDQKKRADLKKELGFSDTIFNVHVIQRNNQKLGALMN
jgi:hypothetical protein